MATPFDQRFLPSTRGRAIPPRTPVPAEHAEEVFSSPAFAPRRHDRHPVGLAIVVGVHLLLAAALLTARLHAGPPAVMQVELKTIDDTVPPPPRPQQLPDAPKTLLHPAVAPIPDVVVDRPETIQVARQEAPAAPLAVTAPAPAKGDGDALSTLSRVAVHPAHIDAGDPRCRPSYPHIAEREGVTGITKLRFTVAADGRVSAELLQTSGPLRENRRMDQAAIEALSHCPVTVGTDEAGRPVGATVDVNYKWTID